MLPLDGATVTRLVAFAIGLQYVYSRSNTSLKLPIIIIVTVIIDYFHCLELSNIP